MFNVIIVNLLGLIQIFFYCHTHTHTRFMHKIWHVARRTHTGISSIWKFNTRNHSFCFFSLPLLSLSLTTRANHHHYHRQHHLCRVPHTTHPEIAIFTGALVCGWIRSNLRFHQWRPPCPFLNGAYTTCSIYFFVQRQKTNKRVTRRPIENGNQLSSSSEL